MSVKSTLYSKFREELLKRKIILNSAENSAVTVFFGVNRSEDLISQDSINLYRSGEAIVNKIMETSNDTSN